MVPVFQPEQLKPPPPARICNFTTGKAASRGDEAASDRQGKEGDGSIGF
jgi:hypothetical protein